MEDVTRRPTEFMDQKLLSFIKGKMSECFGENIPIKLILYGSRARKDHLERSDYDLAVSIPPDLDPKWSSFSVDVQEDSPTLHKIDLVNLGRCTDDLKKNILSEGKVLYEQKG